MLLSTREAAATLTVGTDAFRNERKNVSSQPRVMRGVAIVGSAAINDTEVGIYIEDHYVGNFWNSTAGVVQVDAQKDVYPVGALLIPPGAKVSAIILDAPATNPLIIQVY